MVGQEVTLNILGGCFIDFYALYGARYLFKVILTPH